MFTVYKKTNTLNKTYETEDWHILLSLLEKHDKNDSLFIHAKFESINEWSERVFIHVEGEKSLYLPPVDEQLDQELRKLAN